MGGYGSGMRGLMRYGRRTTSACFSIDVNRFNRENVLHDGIGFVWKWESPKAPALTVTVSEDELTLEYTAKIHGLSEIVKETVFINRTSCNYGGSRPWFDCPGCWKRVGKLYFHAGLFRCRACHKLTYSSCQSSHNATAEAMERVKRIRRKMGAQGEFVYPSTPVPRRPKGMHRTKYKRLHQQLTEAENAFQNAFTNGIQRIAGRRGAM